MSIKSKDIIRAMVGKRISHVDLNEFNDGHGNKVYNPRIYLDDPKTMGLTALTFEVRETESLEYGLQLVLRELEL